MPCYVVPSLPPDVFYTKGNNVDFPVSNGFYQRRVSNRDNMKSDVLVIGAGAAGLMCAITAGQRGRSVRVLEHNERPGKKILISGGGRCNFTNINAGPDNYLSQNPHYMKSALARYRPKDFIALVERHGIAYHEKKLGQLFCDTSSKEIVDMLLQECEWADVDIRLNCRVTTVQKNTCFQVQTNQGVYEADSLVIACGGLSFPKLGVSDFGHRLAEQFGLKVLPRRPGLVPLTFNDQDLRAYAELSGLSVDTISTANGRAFRENILFTHRGVTGPAILQVSSYRGENDPITINVMPDQSAKDLLLANKSDARELPNFLSQHIPRRFAHAWCAQNQLVKPVKHFKQAELEEIGTRLETWTIKPSGTEGYMKAEVTLGGIDTDELSSKTMEARKVPGLYFIGEVVDVTGWLGGYNFQWAWASGHAAGEVV